MLLRHHRRMIDSQLYRERAYTDVMRVRLQQGNIGMRNNSDRDLPAAALWCTARPFGEDPQRCMLKGGHLA